MTTTLSPKSNSLKALTEIMQNEFMAVVKHSGGVHVAFCPEIPEAKAQSNTKIGALAALRVAVIELLDERRQGAASELLAGAELDTIRIE